MFSSHGQKQKRKGGDPPHISACKHTEIQFCLLSQNTYKTPNDEAALFLAGLGRRTVNIPDNANQADVSFTYNIINYITVSCPDPEQTIHWPNNGR